MPISIAKDNYKFSINMQEVSLLGALGGVCLLDPKKGKLVNGLLGAGLSLSTYLFVWKTVRDSNLPK